MFAYAAEGVSSLPLMSLSAIVIDTETTGLNTAKDRVVEIGAVRLSNGRIDEADTYRTLVNPGISIPESTTAIHNINDDHVADQRQLFQCIPEFRLWIGPEPLPVLGFSLGFDLAILQAEHKRHGLRWQAPRSLDVRHLIEVLAPDLPNLSLETAAGWLDIEISDRHSALGDALLTARIFLAIIPKLRNIQILTLAQAERACKKFASRREEEIRAGWNSSAGPNLDTPTGDAEYARIDSFPYRHRVVDIMNAPPVFVDNDSRVKDALNVMVSQQVSSLYLSPEAQGAAYGIVTERDILRSIDAAGAGALEEKISSLASRPLAGIDKDQFVYRAIAVMAARKFRHLAVTDGSDRPIGALSARDLLRQRAGDAWMLGMAIEGAASAAELGQVWSRLTMVVRGLVYEDVDSRDIAAVISHELRALTRRACELAEQEMENSGHGKPPCDYAMLVLGSGGRGESLLAMDQDNAIIYADGSNRDDVDDWFARLGKRVADILNDIGVTYCKGGIMASNAEWRNSESGWLQLVQSWLTRSGPKDILKCDIFFDAIPVHGNFRMGEDIRRQAIELAGTARTFLKFLALNAGEFETPLGWFGRFRLTGGRLDIKKGGIMPLFSSARVLALKQGISAHSTRDRFEAVRDTPNISPGTIDNLIEAHRVLLAALVRQQLRDLRRGVALSNNIAPGELSAHEKQDLRWALEQINLVPGILDIPLHV